MTATSTAKTYAIDASHSSVEFVVRHFMISKVRGRFTGVTGTLEVAADGTTLTGVQASIATGTVATGDEQRDGHLKSPDFFDAGTHPAIEFVSTNFAPSGDGFELHGNLTISGTTNPIVLEATFEGETVDPWGNHRLGYEAHGKLSRKDFGLVWNQTLEAGGVAIGDDVKIELSIEAIANKG